MKRITYSLKSSLFKSRRYNLFSVKSAYETTGLLFSEAWDTFHGVFFQYNVNEVMNCFLCIESSQVNEYFVTNCTEFFSDRKILVLSFKKVLFSYCSHLL